MGTLVHLKGVKGINRYIVGCKFIRYIGDVMGRFRINRYIVGCKFYHISRSSKSCIELIDT